MQITYRCTVCTTEISGQSFFGFKLRLLIQVPPHTSIHNHSVLQIASEYFQTFCDDICGASPFLFSKRIIRRLRVERRPTPPFRCFSRPFDYLSRLPVRERDGRLSLQEQQTGLNMKNGARKKLTTCFLCLP